MNNAFVTNEKQNTMFLSHERAAELRKVVVGGIGRRKENEEKVD